MNHWNSQIYFIENVLNRIVVLLVVGLLFLTSTIHAEEIHDAVRENYELRVRMILDKNPDSVNARGDIYIPDRLHSGSSTLMRNLTPLHIAAYFGYSTIAEVLIDNGASVDAKAKYEKTAMTIAISRVNIGYDSYNFVDMLLRKGVSPNNQLALHTAAQKCSLKISQLLIDKCVNINEIDSYGSTPLHYAVLNCDFPIIKLLVESGANIEARLSYNASVGLSIASNTSDVGGQTPLHLSASEATINVVEYLLSKGAGIEAQDSKGRTPIFMAVGMGRTDVVRLLISKGATLNIKDYNSWSLLHYAAYIPSRYAVTKKMCKAKSNIAESLIAKGADVNGRAEDQRTPLHLAASRGNEATLLLLLKKGIDINSTDNKNVTSLYIACQYGHKNVVKVLLKKSANANIKSQKGISPLMIAACHRETAIVKLLLAHGVDKNGKDNNGLTAMDHAKHFNYNEIVEVLQ